MLIFNAELRENRGYKKILKSFEEWNVSYTTIRVHSSSSGNRILFGLNYSENKVVAMKLSCHTNGESFSKGKVVIQFDIRKLLAILSRYKDIKLTIEKKTNKMYYAEIEDLLTYQTEDISSAIQTFVKEDLDNYDKFDLENCEIISTFKTNEFLETMKVHRIGREEMSMTFRLNEKLVECYSINREETIPIWSKLPILEYQRLIDWCLYLNNKYIFPLFNLQNKLGIYIRINGKIAKEPLNGAKRMFLRIDTYWTSDIELTLFIAPIGPTVSVW